MFNYRVRPFVPRQVRLGGWGRCENLLGGGCWPCPEVPVWLLSLESDGNLNTLDCMVCDSHFKQIFPKLRNNKTAL